MPKARNSERRDTLTVLDVGHGNCAVLKRGRQTYVIDAGPGSSLLEYLKENNVRKLDTVILTHADQDHVGGLIGLISSGYVNIVRVYVNTDSIKMSNIWHDLLYELSRSSTKLHIGLTCTNTGEPIFKKAELEILAPSPYLAGRGPGSVDHDGRAIAANTISAVIRISARGSPLAVLTSDLDSLGLDHLLTSSPELPAPFLVFPHHGGSPAKGDGKAFAARMCSAVRPKAVIFSVGRGRYGNPSPDTIAGVLKSCPGCRIVCTQLSTACAASLPRGKNYHLAGEYAQGREAGKCCAGTITIPLENPMGVRPSRRAHAAFIKRIDNPLCRSLDTKPRP